MANREVKLYEVPAVLERARVLDDSVLGAYNESVMSKYSSETARKNLLRFTSINGELANSNIPMLIHLQESGLLGNSRLATRADLEKALQFGLKLSGNYVDFGVALRGDNVSYANNQTSATNLVSQLKQRGIRLVNGRLMPLSALTQREDSNSGCGLTLALKDNVSAKDLPALDEFKWNYTTREGVASACVVRDGDWSSSNDNLADSSDSGRVVVVGAEGTTQNFLAQLDQTEAEARQAYLDVLNKKRLVIDAELKRLGK